VKHIHFKKIGQFPNSINDDDSNKNIYRYSTLNQLVNIIEKNGHEKDIDEIDNTKVPKFEFFQGECVFVNLAKYDQ